MCTIEAQIIILDTHKYSTYVIEVFGLTFNFLLIYFLTTEKRGTHRSYKVCVIIHCIMDIGLGLFHILGIFQVETVGATIFMTLTGPLQFINVYQVHSWSFVITNFFFSCSIFFGCITIIYRYLVVVKRKTLKTKYIILMSIPVIVVAGVIAFQYVSKYSKVSEEEYEEFKKLLNNKIWARDKFYGNNFIALIIPSTRKEEPFYNYLTISSYIFSIGVIIIFSILISIHLRGNRGNMTKSTLKLEKKIQTTLFIQALFPIILGYIPNILPSIMTLFHVPFQCYIIFVGVCITYIPLINPCILLFMTPQYRRRMFYLICKKKQSIVPKTTTFIK